MHPLSKYKSPESPIPDGTRHITLIGHGNVSLDISRLLLTPLKALSALDLPEHVLSSMERLWQSLQHISIVGRRGPNDVRFTAKELREIMTLECARLVPIPREIMAPESDMGGDDDAGRLSRQQRKLLGILKKGSNLTHGDKTFSIDFWRSPIGYEIRPSPADKRVLLNLEKTKKDQAGGLIGTGSTENIETDLIVTSLGYESDAEMLGADLPWFDKSSGHIRTQPAGGRLISPEGRLIPNIYASGWASRGARGVLAGTMLDAHDVAGALIQDWLDRDYDSTTSKTVATADIESPSTIVGSFADLTPVAFEWPVGGLDSLPPTVETGLQQGRVITYETWRRIDQAEQERGKGEKERERMSWQEVREFLKFS
jgi:adrenodoxin-NADP+ reductase